MNRLKREIFKRKLSCGSAIDCKRSANASAKNILQYGSAAFDSFNNFAMPVKTESNKLRAAAIESMTIKLSSIKIDIRRLVNMRKKGVGKPFAAAYMARARRLNDGVPPQDISEALNIIIKEHIDYARGVILDVRRSRISNS